MFIHSTVHLISFFLLGLLNLGFQVFSQLFLGLARPSWALFLFFSSPCSSPSVCISSCLSISALFLFLTLLCSALSQALSLCVNVFAGGSDHLEACLSICRRLPACVSAGPFPMAISSPCCVAAQTTNFFHFFSFSFSSCRLRFFFPRHTRVRRMCAAR